MSGEAHIHVSRAEHHLHALSRAVVVIDGENRGRIWSGEALAFDVSPGVHDVSVRLQGLRSPVVGVAVGENEICFVCCDFVRFAGLLAPYHVVRRSGLVLRLCERPPLDRVGRWPDRSGIARWRARTQASRRTEALVRIWAERSEAQPLP